MGSSDDQAPLGTSPEGPGQPGASTHAWAWAWASPSPHQALRVLLQSVDRDLAPPQPRPCRLGRWGRSGDRWVRGAWACHSRLLRPNSWLLFCKAASSERRKT